MELNRTLSPDSKPMEPFVVAPPERHILKNGIPLKIIREGAQEVIRLDILIGAGQWQQTQLLQALFTNRMLREGTRSLTSPQIASRLDYYASWLELNTSVQHSWITLYSLNKHFPHTLSVIESLLKEPTFPEEQLEVVLNTNKHHFFVNQNKVSFLSGKGLRHAAFGEEHPMGATAEEWDYDRVTSKCLRDYYSEHYHSGSCSIYMSGYITDTQIKQVEEAFGAIPWGQVKPFQEPLPHSIHVSTQKRTHLLKADAMQSSVRMGWHAMQCTHPDYLKFRVLMTVLGGYFGSRLMSNIREIKGLTYGISASLSNFPDTGLAIVSSETATANVEELIREVYHEMDTLRETLIPCDELEMVRNYLMGETARTYEGAFQLAEAWINADINHQPADHPRRIMQAIQNVTAEELRDLARKYFLKENVFEIVAGQ